MPTHLIGTTTAASAHGEAICAIRADQDIIPAGSDELGALDPCRIEPQIGLVREGVTVTPAIIVIGRVGVEVPKRLREVVGRIEGRQSLPNERRLRVIRRHAAPGIEVDGRRERHARSRE